MIQNRFAGYVFVAEKYQMDVIPNWYNFINQPERR